MQKPAASHELVCSWLGLTPDQWPPDHYTLLGLRRGESESARIEELVHERLMRLRAYQLIHPDQVTEAMNRLARAFSCLTDPAAKRAYDASLEAGPERANPTRPDTGTDSVDPLGWLFGPWSRLAAEESIFPGLKQKHEDWTVTPPPCRPRRDSSWARISRPAGGISAQTAPAEGGGSPGSMAGVAEQTGGADLDHTGVARPAVAAAEASEHPAVSTQESSAVARRGLATRKGVYRRIFVTRALLRAWKRAGRHLKAPERRLNRAKDAIDFIRQLHRIRVLLTGFPPVIGEAGQPGFWVLSLARQQMAIPIFRALGFGQRELLARDWQHGLEILATHRKLLRQECVCLRRMSWLGRLRRWLNMAFAEHPMLLLLLVLVAIVVFVHGIYFMATNWGE